MHVYVGQLPAEPSLCVHANVAVPDLFRSLAFGLGLDPDKVRVAPSGRPIKTVDGGTVVGELFG